MKEKNVFFQIVIMTFISLQSNCTVQNTFLLLLFLVCSGDFSLQKKKVNRTRYFIFEWHAIISSTIWITETIIDGVVTVLACMELITCRVQSAETDIVCTEEQQYFSFNLIFCFRLFLVLVRSVHQIGDGVWKILQNFWEFHGKHNQKQPFFRGL